MNMLSLSSKYFKKDSIMLICSCSHAYKITSLLGMDHQQIKHIFKKHIDKLNHFKTQVL
jgi:hypothetical protein